MILPGIERSGELTDSSKLPWPSRSPFLLTLCERTPEVMTLVEQTELRERSRSSYVSKCLCYNCNVSELILTSRELPPVERFNFDVYFARSLSHKFVNCSCYSSLQPGRSTRVCCRSFNSNRGSNNNGGGAVSSSFVCPKSRFPTCPERQCVVVPCLGSRFDRCIVLHQPGSDHDRKEREKWWRWFDKSVERDESSSWNNNQYIRDTRVPFRNLSCPNVRSDISRVDSVCASEHGETVDCCSMMYRRWSCPNVNLQWHGSLVHAPDRSDTLSHMLHAHDNDVHDDHDNPRKCYRRSKSPREPLSRLQPQRSFSSPDTRPSIIQPDPTCTARRHRHSISGQMSYFKLLGYNINKKLTGSANSLFSTAVISGSSSAPNLKDMVPPHASAVAGESLLLLFFFVS